MLIVAPQFQQTGMGRGALSGINYGENLGLAFTGSGTLGAAFEADSLGIPVIAFSRSIPQQYQKSEDISVTLMTSLMSVDADTYHR